MLNLFDFSIIIEQHYTNLVNDSNRLTVVFLFMIIPFIISSIIVYSNYLLNEDIINNLLVAFTIFTAFLPNVIFIQLGIRKDLKDKKTFGNDAISVSEHLYTDSVYTLLISVLILSILIGLIITNHMGQIVSLIIYGVIIHFLITFLMVIQRVFILFFPTD